MKKNLKKSSGTLASFNPGTRNLQPGPRGYKLGFEMMRLNQQDGRSFQSIQFSFLTLSATMLICAKLHLPQWPALGLGITAGIITVGLVTLRIRKEEAREAQTVPHRPEK